jgi:hypothetical protein
MKPEQDKTTEQEQKDKLRRLQNEIRLREEQITDIEWQLRILYRTLS